MKRLSAILFFFIVVFNFYGYRMVIAYMEKGNDTVLEQKLDNQEYNEAELISIKTTLNLPYYTSSPDYERAYGSVMVNGVVYEYVKKRIYQDTLELLCLPNGAKTKLQGIKNDLLQASADGQATLPLKKASSTLKVFLPDYFQAFATFSTTAVTAPAQYGLPVAVLLFPDYQQQQEKPPQVSFFLS